MGYEARMALRQSYPSVKKEAADAGSERVVYASTAQRATHGTDNSDESPSRIRTVTQQNRMSTGIARATISSGLFWCDPMQIHRPAVCDALWTFAAGVMAFVVPTVNPFAFWARAKVCVE